MWQYYNIQIVQNYYKLGKKIGNPSVFVEKLRLSGLRSARQRIIIIFNKVRLT